MTAADKAEFGAWLAADPRHQSAFAAIEEPFRALDRARALVPEGAMPDPDYLLRGNRPKRRVVPFGAWLAAAGAVAATIAVGALVLRPKQNVLPLPLAPAQASSIEPRTLSLPDGSTMVPGAGARYEIAYSASERLVRLLSGEAYFSVAKDAARPFLVEAGRVAVQAMGTAFEVNAGLTRVEVVVTEGRVRVDKGAKGESLLVPAPQAPAGSAPVLAAGERVMIPIVGGVPVPARSLAATSDELAHARGWSSPWLEFDDTPLAEVAREFNLQGGPQIRIADAAVGQLRVTTKFHPDGRDAFMRLVESHPGLTVNRTSEGDFILSEAK